VSPTRRSRKRGFLGAGEDSSAVRSQCKCAYECVRNPKNGICYFKYTTEGKLVPIMKPETCCRKVGLCNFDNKIEQLMCELSIKNDYTQFSRFLDKNFATN